MVTKVENGNDRNTAVQLCVEFWKLAKAASKTVDLLDEAQGRKLSSQIKFSERQLTTLAAGLEIMIVDFDGEDFHPGLAASADNEDDFETETDLVVTKTIEPAIVSGMSVLKSGRVIVGRKPEIQE